jgi:hypothetical protein
MIRITYDFDGQKFVYSGDDKTDLESLLPNIVHECGAWVLTIDDTGDAPQPVLLPQGLPV